MPAAPVTAPADPVAATRRKLARLLAVGAMRAASAKAAEEPGEHVHGDEKRPDEDKAA